MIKVVLLDLDGVLLEAKNLHNLALNKALKKYGYEITNEEHRLLYDGLPTKVKLQMLTNNKGLPDTLYTTINVLKQENTQELIKALCGPQKEHIEALNSLKRQGYKLGLCSNSIRQTIDTFLGVSKLSSYFDLILSNEDVINPKPDPEIYNKAITYFNSTPDQVLILEDSPYGIQAAQLSGANVLTVLSSKQVTYSFIKDKINELQAG